MVEKFSPARERGGIDMSRGDGGATDLKNEVFCTPEDLLP